MDKELEKLLQEHDKTIWVYSSGGGYTAIKDLCRKFYYTGKKQGLIEGREIARKYLYAGSAYEQNY